MKKNILIPAPTNLRLTISKESTAYLTWNSVEGATGYKVYQSTDPINNDLYNLSSSYTTTQLIANSIEIDWLIGGKTYYFVVKALRDNKNSLLSNEVSGYIVKKQIIEETYVKTYRRIDTVEAIQLIDDVDAIKEFEDFCRPSKFYITETKDGIRYAMLETNEHNSAIPMGWFLVKKSEDGKDKIVDYTSYDFNECYELVNKD